MRANRTAGRSLLDLLTSLAVLGLLISIATPAFSVWREHQQLQSLKAGLFHMTNKARYLAITSQSRVTICSLSEQGFCQQRWRSSITSFIDGNGNRRFDPADEIVNTLYLPNNISLHWSGMLPNNSIHFSSQGVTFVSNGTMSLCPDKPGAKSGSISISRQGRVKASSEDARCLNESTR